MKITLLFFFLLSILRLSAQGIKIGETFPEITVKDVFNHDFDQLNFANYKGKAIILDFWDVTCKSCIRAFSKLDSLQKEFKDKVQIVLINRQTKEVTRKFFENRKKFLLPDLPFITNDKILNKYFPHGGEPFTVWIDSNRKVRYATNGYNATSDNITQFLGFKDIGLRTYGKKKIVGSLISKENLGAIGYFSYLSHCINGVIVAGLPDSLQLRGITVDCASVIELFQRAYNEYDKYQFNRIGRTIVNVKDSVKYMRPFKNVNIDYWKENFSYTYQLGLMKNKMSLQYDIMKSDLERYFDLDARVEKRYVRSLVLVRTSDVDKLSTKSSTRVDSFYRLTPESARKDIPIRFLRNVDFSEFSKTLSYFTERLLVMPYSDQTNYKGNIDIDIKGSVLDGMYLPDLINELRKYDLDLVEKDLLLNVLIIRDK